MTYHVRCSCPACKYERSGSLATYIPVGVELLEELDAHPERAAEFLNLFPSPQSHRAQTGDHPCESPPPKPAP